MEPKLLKPRNALNKAYLKVKPNRTEIEKFKTNLTQLIDNSDDSESEEFHKNLVSDFLKKTWYAPQHFINTKGRNDLVIHNGNKATSSVGVIIEAKKPTNKSEMLSKENLNAKAFHELILYYLRERIKLNNLEIKHLIATNINEWFVFDARVFENYFAHDKTLVKQFKDFEDGRLAGTSTDFFYQEIAEPFVEKIKIEIEFTWFDIRDFETPLRNNNPKDDNKLIALFKLLSPEHMLKLPFANDSNSLDKRFYTELLHIIGLTETKQGSKKLIERNPEEKRNSGSLLENVILQLDSLDKIGRLDKPGQFGVTTEERLFNVGLELCITWINRILFLKLLEAQLLSYHNGDKAFEFLSSIKIRNYDDLNTLFFQVLARKAGDRNEDVRELFAKVPYLNSSLFDPTELEHSTLFISNLNDDKTIPILSSTVLKDDNGKKKSGKLTTLDYLFQFLNVYDFSSEGSEEIQEENKTLINASVLGLIFEKINGYKDGSFFTPGFITMYMSRETIRRAVVQKFNEIKNWTCESIDDLYNKIEDRQEANRIVNSLKICDPAVGSGHFLVSALNEIISIKNDLRILSDRECRRLKEYNIEVVNDELIVTDENGELFDYNPKSRESQRVQEALFHEKQTLIENCLFGVDINPNSVKICRLRLWIELLKNAYYINTPSPSQEGSSRMELQTLPNIDINIKTGNSLISRFAIDADLGKALSSKKWTIESYRSFVDLYRNAENKEQKRQMEKLISDIKNDFRSEITLNDPKMKKLMKVKGDITTMTTQTQMFEMTSKQKAEWNKKLKKLAEEQQKLEAQIEEIKNNKIYENAFEWRFEFPEVLNEKGDFTGFDVVIGNPPYIRQEEFKELKPYLQSQYKLYTGTTDIYVYFIEKGFEILKTEGSFTFIMPNKFMQAGYGQPVRKFLLNQNLLEIINFGDYQVFDEATTYPCIIRADKRTPTGIFYTSKISSPDFIADFPFYIANISNSINHTSLTDETWIVSNTTDQNLLHKVGTNGIKLEDYIDSTAKRGILTGLTEAFVIDETKKNELIARDSKSIQLLKPFLLGRNIKPYSSNNVLKWLILVPKGFTIRKNLPSDNPFYLNEPPPRYGSMELTDAWSWFKSNFPAIADHLLQFEQKAEARIDKGDFWWELRACDYYDKFEKPKIMYQVLQVKPCFIYDENGLFCNNSMWFIPADDKVLLGILNSKMGWWLISKYCTAIQNGYQLIWKYFSQIPIVTGEEDKRERIKDLVDEILKAKKQNSDRDTSPYEARIDQLVYELYGLTEEEIRIVEESEK